MSYTPLIRPLIKSSKPKGFRKGCLVGPINATGGTPPQMLAVVAGSTEWQTVIGERYGMPYKDGVVVNVEGNGWAEVVTDKLDACADCVSARNCPSDCKSAKMVTRVRDNVGAHVGDTVSVYVSRKSMLKSAAMLYLVPVVFLLIGAGIGSLLAPIVGLGNSTASLIVGLAGLCFGYFLVKAFSMRLSAESGLFPKIDRILYQDADEAYPSPDSIHSSGERHEAVWHKTTGNSPPPPA